MNVSGGERILKDSGGKPREQSSPPSQFFEGDLLEWAWAVIANASGGDWTKESPEWQAAAAKWRDSWLKTLRGGESVKEQCLTDPGRCSETSPPTQFSTWKNPKN